MDSLRRRLTACFTGRSSARRTSHSNDELRWSEQSRTEDQERQPVSQHEQLTEHVQALRLQVSELKALHTIAEVRENEIRKERNEFVNNIMDAWQKEAEKYERERHHLEQTIRTLRAQLNTAHNVNQAEKYERERHHLEQTISTLHAQLNTAHNFNQRQKSVHLLQQAVRFAFDPASDAHLVASNGLYVRSKGMRRYWRQRYQLFTKFNKGVLMDRECWHSVTPEALALHIAQRCCRRPGLLVVDGFCGAGSNAIQFALRPSTHVIAIDRDPVKIKCARRNAEIYGVSDRIEFVCADYFHAIGGIRAADVVFLAAPWGGPGYMRHRPFDLHKHMKPDGLVMFAAARAVTDNVVMFVPRNTDTKQLKSLAAADGLVEMEQSFSHDADSDEPKLTALTVYYGRLADRPGQLTIDEAYREFSCFRDGRLIYKF